MQVWLHRFRSRMRQRSVLLLFMLLAYLAICLGLALWGVQTIGLLALTPLLLTPLVAYLAYWLVWREFHE